MFCHRNTLSIVLISFLLNGNSLGREIGGGTEYKSFGDSNAGNEPEGKQIY